MPNKEAVVRELTRIWKEERISGTHDQAIWTGLIAQGHAVAAVLEAKEAANEA